MKNVVIGVSGGIAAYKALDVVSALRKLNINVDVIMTDSAQEFVQPLSFQSLSQNPVITDMFTEPKVWEIAHITLSQKADLFAVVPATANVIGKMANGIADDFLTTAFLATEAPTLVAPAMNTKMYNHPMVRENMEKLKSFGTTFIRPGSGRLACGDIGEGKLAAVEDIVAGILSVLHRKEDFKGRKVLVTAGGTHAPIDPVRILTNKSSGKMGIRIAEAARDRGADVVLVHGEVTEPLPDGVERIFADTNEAMRDAVLSVYDGMDYVFMAAAVSDYRLKQVHPEKIKKGEADLTLELVKDRDILQELGERKKEQILVGFAAESSDLEENAVGKLRKKHLDFIAANDISEGKVFGRDMNSVVLYDKDGNKHEYGELSKKETAERLLDDVSVKG